MANLNNYPTISVIIPSFNQGQYIEETLLSVLGQRYPKLEILVIDGGSTDNTVEILEKYTSELHYWHSRPDKGQADAINQGIKLSSGNVLCWLNSDDMYLPGTLLDIGKRFEGLVDNYHLVYGGAITISQMKQSLESNTGITATFDPVKLTYFDYITQPSAFWTRKLWYSVGELNVNYKYVLDWEWFIRASSIAEFDYVSKFYSVCRYHPLHKTSTGGAERRKEILEIIQKFASDYWIELYSETERCYDKIIETRNFLTSCRIPRAHWIIPFLFPHLLGKIKKFQDFLDVWVILGF